MFLIIFTLVIIYLVYEFYLKRRNLPPGPTPLPFIGNIHTLARYEPGYAAFEAWKRQFGKIYTMWFANAPIVVISDYELMKETFVKDGDSYVGKMKFEVVQKAFRDGDYGIIDTSDDMWREHRRFALHTFRNLGVGKQLMEQKILCEVDVLTQELNEKSTSGQTFNVQDTFDLRVGCVINSALFGYRFDDKTIDEFRHLKDLLTEGLKSFADPMMQITIMYPWTKYIPIGPIGRSQINLLVRNKIEFFKFFDKQIAEHKSELDENAECNDYVEAYLREKKRHEEAGDFTTYSLTQLKNCLSDLWSAGLETTSNTLTWALIYVLNNPQVQTKMHEELDRVINSKRQITMADKNNLPYTNAVVNEVQRLANLLPMNLVHELTRDVEIEGYHLKKGTAVLAQISTVLYDEKIFPDSYSFKPERFLDANGSLKKVDELIPFSIGKRVCLGESLARMELFLFTANLFNRFELTSEQKPSLLKTFGTTMKAQSFNCRAQTRN